MDLVDGLFVVGLDSRPEVGLEVGDATARVDGRDARERGVLLAAVGVITGIGLVSTVGNAAVWSIIGAGDGEAGRRRDGRAVAAALDGHGSRLGALGDNDVERVVARLARNRCLDGGGLVVAKEHVRLVGIARGGVDLDLDVIAGASAAGRKAHGGGPGVVVTGRGFGGGVIGAARSNERSSAGQKDE